MGSQISRLPRRFPAGTRYVIEGRGGHIHLRYLEFPDGRQISLPTDLERKGPSAAARPRRRPHKRGPKKFLSAAGTAGHLGG